MGFQGFSLMFVLVPALIGLVALFMLFTAVRNLLRGMNLASRGQRTTGRVISANLHISGGKDNRTSTMIETIEFTTDRGQTVRTTPLRGDIGMLDRSGQEVPVLYDRDRPERMIAPKNGRSLSPWGPLSKIVFSLVMLGFLTFFVVMSQGMLSLFPF
ncbi:DUF3592 domain-containing protein [Brachybacterium massiliense]|uniref:DUF3592 domain-containing protein n=1 Tax=Brachybacterium massiliense TaxID=1755098 RepID=UPI000B3BC046|nr:DUF3592 domain-containing protein [Brachybacterium massiliense]